MSDPTKDPNFSGVKQPAFDTLVGSYARAVNLLDQLAHDLWAQLNLEGVDTAPALRIRAMAAQMSRRVVELRSRQAQVHAMEKANKGVGFCVPSGTYWELPDSPPPESDRPPLFPKEPPELSHELDDASTLSYPTIDPEGLRFSDEEDAVLSWIELHREAILREARARNIPPTAITAAIAWEAMHNKKKILDPNPFGIVNPIPPGWPLGQRWFGPGKVHSNSPLAEQTEERGYLPRVSRSERDDILGTDVGSIKYIAAEMGAFADLGEQDGRFPSIRNDIPMLTQLYQGSDLHKWGKSLAAKDPAEPFRAENDMPVWVQKNPKFVEAMDEALRATGVPRARTIDPPAPGGGDSPRPVA